MAITHIEIIIEQIGGRINGFINSSCFQTVSMTCMLVIDVGDEMW